MPGVLAFRFDASLHFANKDYFYSAVSAALIERRASCGHEGLSVVVIDFSPVNDVDASALRMLQDLLKEMGAQSLRLLLSGCKGPIRDLMARSGGCPPFLTIPCPPLPYHPVPSPSHLPVPSPSHHPVPSPSHHPIPSLDPSGRESHQAEYRRRSE